MSSSPAAVNQLVFFIVLSFQSCSDLLSFVILYTFLLAVGDMYFETVSYYFLSPQTHTGLLVLWELCKIAFLT